MTEQIGLIGGFLGGVLSILSPCSALLLPAFFAYAFGTRRVLLARTGLFLLGLAIVLVPLGAGVGAIGSLFTKPLSGNTELTALLTKATELPTRGFERPVLMTQTLQDTSVVVPLTLKYLNDARVGDSKVSARTYLTLDGAQSKRFSDADIRAFVARVLR